MECSGTFEKNEFISIPGDLNGKEDFFKKVCE